MSKVCNKCGAELDDNAIFCDECGTRYEEEKMTEQNEVVNTIKYTSNSTQTKKNKNPMATASLVLGIIGVLTGIMCIGIFPSIIGMILGIIGLNKKNKPKGKAIAGLILSIFGIVICILMICIAGLLADDSKQESVEKQSKVITETENNESSELLDDDNKNEDLHDDNEGTSSETEITVETKIPDVEDEYNGEHGIDLTDVCKKATTAKEAAEMVEKLGVKMNDYDDETGYLSEDCYLEIYTSDTGYVGLIISGTGYYVDGLYFDQDYKEGCKVASEKGRLLTDEEIFNEGFFLDTSISNVYAIDDMILCFDRIDEEYYMEGSMVRSFQILLRYELEEKQELEDSQKVQTYIIGIDYKENLLFGNSDKNEITIYVDDIEIGKMKYGEINNFEIELTPGKHTIKTKRMHIDIDKYKIDVPEAENTMFQERYIGLQYKYNTIDSDGDLVQVSEFPVASDENYYYIGLLESE